MQKKGQVTIFIILGIILLGSAMFLFFIVENFQKEGLITAQEDVIQKSFQREGMRLYIEDCLIDSLEEGLILIGKQGRLWEGQEGGKISFQEGSNGLNFALTELNRLYYGVSYEEYNQFPESYPCKSEKDDSPDFCRYSYPSKAEFGSKEKLTRGTIKSDLIGHLKSKTISCVGEFLESNLSISKDLLEGEPTISLEFEPEGISIKAEYPIELSILDETFFHLTEFNFFYPSNIRSFLTTAVTGPLKKEAEQVDYNYSKDDLENSFIYQSLSPTFEKFNQSNGDTVIRFQLEDGVILKEQEYLFQFAIQNRPPALDYLGKDSCDYYDYLILPDAEVAEHRLLNISANAIDPDGHNLTYTCETDLTEIRDQCKQDPQQEVFISHQFGEGSATPGMYYIKINATDEFGLSDSQNMVIKIEEPINIGVNITHPYTSSIAPIFSDGKAWLSIEDPAFVTVSFPSSSNQVVTLNYFRDDNPIFNASPSNIVEDIKCFSFPRTAGDDGFINCDIGDYESQITTWNSTFFSDDSMYPYFQKTTNNGRISLKFEAEYCGDISIGSSGDSVDVKVTRCLPHINKAYPWPWPKHRYEYHLGSDGKTNFSNLKQTEDYMNPFLATHACCTPDGNYASTETICYQGEPSCHGKFFEDLNLQGYILEASTSFCSGDRGNICSGESGISLNGGTLICGSPEYDGCDDSIPLLCQEKTAWGIQSHPFTSGETLHYWCNGAMGCMNVCEESNGDAIVYLDSTSPNDLLSMGTGSDAMTNLALNLRPTSNIASPDGTFKFSCGCSGNDGFSCDSNYDGSFNGVCNSETCEGDS